MTSRECFENKLLYMKYIGKYLSGEILWAVSVAGLIIFLDLCTEMLSGTGLLTFSVNVFDFTKLFLRCVILLLTF